MKSFHIAKGSHIEDLSGMGVRLWGGCWNHKGVAVVYASESRALAANEFNILINPGHKDFGLIETRCPT